MHIGADLLFEMAVATIGGLAAVGLTVLKLAMHGMEKQHEATQKMILERFQWAEEQRQASSHHWNQHFDEVKQGERDIDQRVRCVENRINTLEVWIHQHDPHEHPHISIKKAP